MEIMTEEQALEAAIKEQYGEVAGRRFGLAAFKRGWADHKESRMRCPYPDHRTNDNKVTFARAYRRAWQRGVEARRKYSLGIVRQIDLNRIEELRGYLTGTREANNGAAMRAIVYGWQPDWNMPADERLNEALAVIRGKITEIEFRLGT